MRQKTETDMLNFDEELRKFKPSMEIDDIEDALYQEKLTDSGDAGREADRQRDPRTDRQ